MIVFVICWALLNRRWYSLGAAKVDLVLILDLKFNKVYVVYWS